MEERGKMAVQVKWRTQCINYFKALKRMEIQDDEDKRMMLIGTEDIMLMIYAPFPAPDIATRWRWQ